jgi:coatomer subunit beta
VDSADTPTVESLRSSLEKGSDEVKIATMKKVLRGMLNGEPFGSPLLMHVIRFVMPSRSKPLKKLLNLFWEIVPKHQADGKLKQEMILVWYGHTKFTVCSAPLLERNDPYLIL